MGMNMAFHPSYEEETYDTALKATYEMALKVTCAATYVCKEAYSDCYHSLNYSDPIHASLLNAPI